MINKPTIKERIKQGKFILGTWCEIPSPFTVNVLAKAGLDFIIIDMEHGPANFDLAQQMVMASEADGCEAIIRISNNNESDILRSLDTGASGIIVPHIKSVEEIKKLVNFAKFYPTGTRSFNPYIRAGSYHATNSSYFSKQNDKTLLAVMLECTDGLKELGNIVSDPEIDVVYIGTYDLSVALGVPGDVKNRKVIDALVDATARIRGKGKSVGCMIHDTNDLKMFKEVGIQFITYKTDTAILYDSFFKIKDELLK